MNDKIGIIGAGLIGRSWAIVFARAGFSVAIHDVVPEALASCRMLLRENIDDLARHGLLGESGNDWDRSVIARIDAERRAKLPAEKISERSRWRDQRLMALVSHKRKQAL